MKVKTKKIAAKRFRLSKKGTLLRGHQNARHLRRRKSKSQLRRMKTKQQVAQEFSRTIRTFLPYG